ncbi:MAG TPA: TonB C-terminal domain-containing protein [Candidatus Acidoferrales bacterium]|nr:TonB C-terminal domain-containing protein [Candidatus Acidoferrales bacterium]
MKLPRTLIPFDCPAPAGVPGRSPRRLKTWLDVRTLIPQDLPVIAFSGGSNIPTHVPLDVLDNRILIQRDLPVQRFLLPAANDAQPTVTAMDERVVVPATAHLEPNAEAAPFPLEALRDLVETDLLVTGEARLLPESGGKFNWDWLSPAVSIVFHLLLIVSFLTVPRMLGIRSQTPLEEALNQQNLGYLYLPKNLEKIPKPKPQPEKPSNQMKIDVGALRKLAPPKPDVSREEGPVPQPTPATPPPQPPPAVKPAPPAQPEPKPQQPQPRLEPVAPAPKPRGLILPDLSPGRAIQDSLRSAAQDRQPSIGFSDRLPPPPAAPGGQGPQGGPGPGYLAGSVQMLTPTEGVDFTSYIARLLAVVRRNWYAVMPESARLGDQGRVMLRFRILRDGSIPSDEPILEMTSGKQPLDRAAAASITATNPFDPLPQAYTGPYIELRFIFLYNLPLNSQ